jgi:hypothetical protein
MISSPETEFLPNKDFPLQDFYTKHLSQDWYISVFAPLSMTRHSEMVGIFSQFH